MSSDEDEIDDASQEYLEKLQDKVEKASAQHGVNVNSLILDSHRSDDDDDDDSDYEGNEETTLECYITPLDFDENNQDEYVVFKEVMQSEQNRTIWKPEKSWIIRNFSIIFHFLDIERTDQAWYRALTSHLTAEQQKALQEVILLADQRKAALESKRIEQSGGEY